MTCKNTNKFQVLGPIIAISVMIFGISSVYAEESSQYNMIGDVSPVLTFTFRDGIETYEFPVFNMGENLISNSGVTFSVEGTVTNSPLLHKAIDDAFKYRLVSGNGLDFQTKYFDVDVDFVKENQSVLMFEYNNCKIENYNVETLDSNDYESYFKEVGFAIVDKIDFECSGVDYENNPKMMTTTSSFSDYGESEFSFANNMRTSATFSFDGGMEKIEFPAFELISGYEESTDLVTAEFELEGIVDNYPLLYQAIDKSRQVHGLGSSVNPDFEVMLEFTNGETTLRGFDFRDCRVNDAKITTQTDKEEGFTGKSGFAIVNQIGIACSGFEPINMYYAELDGDAPIWKTNHKTNHYEEPIQNSDKGLRAVTVFSYPNGNETVEFSMFSQDEVISTTESTSDDAFTKKSVYPTFELRGIVGDYPMLYKSVDDNKQIRGVAGTQLKTLYDVDVQIMMGDNLIRGFDYSNCRTIDYTVKTDTNKEESYVKNKFALENIFNFECQGYLPYNPMYENMMNTYEKADTTSTMDLKSTDDWGPGFYQE